MPFLPAETLHLGHRHPLNPHFAQRILHFLQLERLDDRFDFLHKPELSVHPYPKPAAPCTKMASGTLCRTGITTTATAMPQILSTTPTPSHSFET
jgi:hypothetical protein